MLDKEKHFKDLRNFLRGVKSDKLSAYVRFNDGNESVSIFDPSGGPLRNLSEMEMVVKDWTEAPSNLEQIMNYFKTGAIEPSPEIKSEARQQASPVVANPVAQQALKVFGVALKPTGRDLSN